MYYEDYSDATTMWHWRGCCNCWGCPSSSCNKCWIGCGAHSVTRVCTWCSIRWNNVAVLGNSFCQLEARAHRNELQRRRTDLQRYQIQVRVLHTNALPYLVFIVRVRHTSSSIFISEFCNLSSITRSQTIGRRKTSRRDGQKEEEDTSRRDEQK